MILTVSIPSIESRRDKFIVLKQHLLEQITEHGLKNDVEVISLIDNKEISIGAKRQRLYEMAKGEYCVQIDDDDSVPYDYCKEVVNALKLKPTHVGYVENCSTNGVTWGLSLFSNRYQEWHEKKNGILIDGKYDHFRTPFMKTPIRTDICLAVGVDDMRFGEDHEFAKRVYPFLNKEVFIDREMYYYRYEQEEFHQKYGIAR
jgi:glycosyltransferase involved in cell wall biosynthesis